MSPPIPTAEQLAHATVRPTMQQAWKLAVEFLRQHFPSYVKGRVDVTSEGKTKLIELAKRLLKKHQAASKSVASGLTAKVLRIDGIGRSRRGNHKFISPNTGRVTPLA